MPLQAIVCHAKIPPLGSPSLFFPSPSPPAPHNLRRAVVTSSPRAWVNQGNPPVLHQPREVEQPTRKSCGHERLWGTWVGRGYDVVSPSETVVISPLMGEIVWECDCVSGNSHKLSLSLSTQLPFVFRLVQSSNRARFRLSI